MNNEQILKLLIEKNKLISEKKIDQKTDDIEKFLVFDLEGQRYALKSNEVKEIVLNSEIFFIPFLPKYLRGIINRQGEPYTVLDLKYFFLKELLDGKKFLIMNSEYYQLAFIISEIYEFINVKKEDIHEIKTKEEECQYFSGSFSYKGNEIFIIDAKKIEKKIEDDIK